MEDEKIQIIGNEYSIFDYNLNKQFLNLNKLIITGDVILDSFEELKIKDIFEALSKTDSLSFSQVFQSFDLDQAFQSNLSNEFYKKIQEKLGSKEISNIKLNNYNFMNSVSNSKYTITLRSEGFSKSLYYEEKGQLMHGIKNLLKDYLKNKVNSLNPSMIKRFQIEIYESEEIYKSIFLKKESSSIILSAAFGFMNSSPMNFISGQEFYFSIGEDFKFYKNTQTKAIVRDHNKLETKEIKKHEKILSNEELISINNMTKNIHDALIEIFINDKGKIKIANLTNLENEIYTNSEFGFIINKSSNNFDKISLLSIRDSLEEETINPKYLLLRNIEEIKEFLENLNKANLIDGIITTENFYDPILDFLGKKFNIDIVYLKQNLAKSLETELDLQNVCIKLDEEKSSNNQNPFSAILSSDKKKDDEFLERLKNIDLNSPPPLRNTTERENISNMTQSLISSENSSINKTGSSNTFAGMGNSIPGKKKSAIEMLADSVLNPKPIEQPTIPKEEPTRNNEPNFSQSSFVMKDIHQSDLNPVANNAKNLSNSFGNFSNENNLEASNNNNDNSEIKSDEIKKYEGILATKIITEPKIKSGTYFANMESLPQIDSGEIYFMTTSNQNLNNPSLNYIIPIEIENVSEKAFLLVSSLNDYFLIKDDFKSQYFFSISQIEESLRESFIKNAIKKIGNINLIISKRNLNLIENHINHIDRVFIKDIENYDEYELIKEKILGFEKKFLIRNS